MFLRKKDTAFLTQPFKLLTTFVALLLADYEVEGKDD